MRTIKSAREIDSLFREARRVGTPLVTLLLRETPAERGPGGRVAFVAGKRLGGAVVRNRSKRVLRAATARQGGPWQGFDVIMIASANTRSAPSSSLDEALGGALRRGGLIP